MKTQIPAHALANALGKLSMLKFFPANEGALKAVGAILTEQCADEVQLNQAVNEILKSENEWPGPATFKKLVESAIPEKPKFSSRGVDPNAFYVPERGDESDR